jgi:MFS family permease
MFVMNVTLVLSSLALYSGYEGLQAALAPGGRPGLQFVGGTLAISGVLAIISIIVGLAGAIVGLVGVGFIARGRREFGSSHARAVSGAVALVVIAGLIFVGTFVVTLFIGAGEAEAMARPDMTSISAALRGTLAGLAVTSLLALLGTGVACVAMLMLVRELMTKAGRRQRVTFAVFSMAGPVLAWIASIVAAGTSDGVPRSFASQAEQLSALAGLLAPLGILILVTALGAFLALISVLVYYWMLDDAAEGARNMVLSGTFVPDPVPRPYQGPNKLSAPPRP